MWTQPKRDGGRGPARPQIQEQKSPEKCSSLGLICYLLILHQPWLHSQRKAISLSEGEQISRWLIEKYGLDK